MIQVNQINRVDIDTVSASAIDTAYRKFSKNIYCHEFAEKFYNFTQSLELEDEAVELKSMKEVFNLVLDKLSDDASWHTREVVDSMRSSKFRDDFPRVNYDESDTLNDLVKKANNRLY